MTSAEVILISEGWFFGKVSLAPLTSAIAKVGLPSLAQSTGLEMPAKWPPVP
jgi:hypothetical protein